MKKIGFIDYYLDEWHANNYPEMFRQYTEGLEVAYAYGMIDSPKGGLTNKQWGEKYGIEVLDSIEEVIEKSDYLIVLSPDNPEMHEELCELPLKSGKNTYIDKTFADTVEIAKRIFKMAEEGHTKCYSTSALFFAEEYQPVYERNVDYIDSCGPNSFEIYAIHQLEPITAMVRSYPARAMAVADSKNPTVILEYENGKVVKVALFSLGGPFSMNIGYADSSAELIEVKEDFWKPFICSLGAFFKTGEIPVPHENTLAVIAAREAGMEALKKPYEWVEVRK